MEIFGRKVTAYSVDEGLVLDVYVGLKQGDCQKAVLRKYECFDNCAGSFLKASFFKKEPMLVETLVTSELYIHPELRVKDLQGLEELTMRYGYDWLHDEDISKKMLVINGYTAATYTYCHLEASRKLWTEEGALTAVAVVMHIDGIYNIASERLSPSYDADRVLEEAER